MKELNIGGMTVAYNVVETIVSIAAKEVEGVEAVGMPGPGGLLGKISSGATPSGVEIAVDDEDKLRIAIRVDVDYGYPLPQLADKVREAIADAVAMQLGLQVSSIDVYIDGIQFNK